MHQRFLSWLLIGVCCVAFALRVEAQGTLDKRGKILVAKVTGNATKKVNGNTTRLTRDMDVEVQAIVNTGPNSSVVLVFSNGATTRLGADSELVIDEFMQDPFADTIKVKELTEEPSPSRTKLSLNRGELVGDVKKLKRPTDGFTVQTPVGAAGIRGTVFQIVFRPTPGGPATFQLTTTSGRVDYLPPGTTVTATGTANLIVPQGQEIVMTVDVSVNAQGQAVVTPIGPNTAAQVVTISTEIATAVVNTTFSPSTGGAPPSGTVGSIPSGTSSQFVTQNTSGTATTTSETPSQNAIPSGQITSQP